MSDAAAESNETPEKHELRLGLLAAPGLARDLADVLAGRLASLLEERVPDIKWQMEVKLGAGAFGLTSAAIWRVGDAMGWPRLLALALVSISAITVTLIVAHGLWERPRSPFLRHYW